MGREAVSARDGAVSVQDKQGHDIPADYATARARMEAAKQLAEESRQDWLKARSKPADYGHLVVITAALMYAEACNQVIEATEAFEDLVMDQLAADMRADVKAAG
jgi:hypothetical protein